MLRFVFVGEQRSATAKRKDWTWLSGRLAAKPLFEALRAIDVEPTKQIFVNLWRDDGTIDTAVPTQLKRRKKRMVVALGQKVSRGLTSAGIKHVAIVHPAARGKIRKRERYIKHVADRLQPALRACQH